MSDLITRRWLDGIFRTEILAVLLAIIPQAEQLGIQSPSRSRNDLGMRQIDT